MYKHKVINTKTAVYFDDNLCWTALKSDSLFCSYTQLVYFVNNPKHPYSIFIYCILYSVCYLWSLTSSLLLVDTPMSSGPVSDFLRQSNSCMKCTNHSRAGIHIMNNNHHHYPRAYTGYPQNIGHSNDTWNQNDLSEQKHVEMIWNQTLTRYC